MSTQLAAQLYTLRDYTRTPADMAATFAKLAAQGWRAVQASALGPIAPKELRKLLDDCGLQCVATHRSVDQLRDVNATLDEHAALGCAYTAIGGFFPKPEDHTRAVWSAFAADFGKVVEQYDGTALRVGYHNHQHEFAKLAPAGLDDERAIDLLARELPATTWWEWDTYWVQIGGGDPAAWVERFAGRVPCVHLKDVGLRADRTPYMMEVGAGNLNWPGILAACKRAGVEWYVVEQDTCWRDPFESLATSLKNLKAMGLQ